MNLRVASALLTLHLMGCATSPTGRKQLILLPESEVAELGAAAFEDLKKQERVSTDAALNAYVQCVAGAIIAANRDRVSGAWEVVAFDSDQINAFALPGRKIGVYGGMAAFADNPAQLAAVVGHEVGHVLARHGNERTSQALVAQGGLSAIAAYTGGGETQQLLLAALGVGADLGIIRPFSRAHESESDEIGLELMAKAGFEPQQAVALWRKMATLGSSGPEFLSTHPSSENRAKALMEQQPAVQPLFQRAQNRPACTKPANLRAPATRG